MDAQECRQCRENLTYDRIEQELALVRAAWEIAAQLHEIVDQFADLRDEIRLLRHSQEG